MDDGVEIEGMGKRERSEREPVMRRSLSVGGFHEGGVGTRGKREGGTKDRCAPHDKEILYMEERGHPIERASGIGSEEKYLVYATQPGRMQRVRGRRSVANLRGPVQSVATLSFFAWD